MQRPGKLCFWQVFQGLLPIGLAFSAGHCGRCWWHLSTCVVVIEKLGTHSLFCFCQSWTCIEPLSTGWLFLVRTPSILSIYGTTPNRLLASRFHVVELCGSAQARVYHDILQERQCLLLYMENHFLYPGFLVAVLANPRNCTGKAQWSTCVCTSCWSSPWNSWVSPKPCWLGSPGWGPGCRMMRLEHPWAMNIQECPAEILGHLIKNHNSVYRTWTGFKLIKRGTVEVKI